MVLGKMIVNIAAVVVVGFAVKLKKCIIRIGRNYTTIKKLEIPECFTYFFHLPSGNCSNVNKRNLDKKEIS